MQIDANGGAAYGNRFFQADIRSASLSASRSQAARLEVVTAEGDRVSLTTSRTEDLSMDRYEARVRSAAGQGVRRAERVSFETTSSIALEVQGDLNEEELADIQRLVEDIEGLGASLLSGELSPRLALGDSLAAAQGQLSVSEQLAATVRRTSQTARQLEPGRAQRRAARRAEGLVRRRPERAEALQRIVPRLANRIFDRLGAAFGSGPAEAARSSFQSLLQSSLARDPAATEAAAPNPYASLDAPTRTPPERAADDEAPVVEPPTVRRRVATADEARLTRADDRADIDPPGRLDVVEAASEPDAGDLDVVDGVDDAPAVRPQPTPPAADITPIQAPTDAVEAASDARTEPARSSRSRFADFGSVEKFAVSRFTASYARVTG